MDFFKRVYFFALLLFVCLTNVYPVIELQTKTNLPSAGLFDNDFTVPYRPGIDFESLQLNNTGSFQSLMPSSSVVVKANGTAGQVNTVAIDGGFSSHTGVAIEGLPLDFPQNSSVDASLIPFEFCERVEIYKNNLSPLGFSSSAGLVNFRLPNPSLGKKQISLFGGSYLNFGIKGLYSRAIGDNSFLLGGSFIYADNNYITVNNNITNHNSNLDYTKYSFIASIKGQRYKTIFTHTGKFSGTGTKYMGKARQSDFLSTMDINYNLTTKLQPIKFNLAYINWRNYYSNSAIAVDDTHWNHTIKAGAKTTFDFQQLKIRTSLVSKSFFVDSTKIGQYFDQQFDLVVDTVLTASIFEIAAAINNNYRITTGYTPIPSFSLNIKFLQWLHNINNISRVYTSPSFNDLYWQKDAFSVGNPNLVSEDGVKIKSGLVAMVLPFYISASFAYTAMDELIQWKPNSDGLWQPNNIGKIVAYVGNFGIGYKQLFGGILLDGNISFSYNKTLNNDPASFYYGKRIIYVPLYKFSASVLLSHKKTWKFGVFFRQVSERYTTELNTAWLEPYYLLDITARYRFVFVSVNNILNQQYEEVEGYPLMGINFKAGVDFEL